ncbi:peptidoglycan recognition protein [Streptomyces sp. 549]|uniref:peptidoglycan recognition protein family protein n=1 Tax=Streptomyces sp. 549 TaxID=3049076 RepID=UPI0024C2D6AF|nr:peptidoglycan recognition protein [Streptomyces sp. 549]MDK1475733.1 peptidoglycan recognition protein [Streptomyces sp. 549]
MRGILASSIGVVCSALLAVPLALPAAANPAAPADGTALASDTGRPAGTQSLPLTPLDTGNQSPRSGTSSRDSAGQQAATGLAAREVSPFSLLGVVWEDATQELHGQVQVRTRSAADGEWSAWQELEAHSADAPDPDSPERTERAVRGATAPMWVGDADGIEVRVLPERAPHGEHGGADDRHAHGSGQDGPDGGDGAELPDGLRVELIDPGSGPADPGDAGASADLDADGRTTDSSAGADASADASAGADTDRVAAPPDLTPEAEASSAANAQLAPLGADLIPPLTKEQTEAELLGTGAATGTGSSVTNAAAEGVQGAQSRPFIGPRPGIVTRKGWQADERLREKNFAYTGALKAAFVHHTAMSNNYTCQQAPSIIRGIYQYHVKSLRWRDIGYNFLVDKCGTIYEGRAGGVAKPVMGAHTYGFNSNSMGVAVLGSYGSTAPPRAAVDGVAKLTAWKLGLHGANPAGSTTLTSGGGKYAAGTRVTMRTISGHRDGFATECPGAQLYGNLGTARATSARLQGR